jgi:hypothetical protein
MVHPSELEDEIGRLRDLDLPVLRARWRNVFRRKAPEHLPRHLLFRILAYRLQSERLGDLDQETARMLARIASENGGNGVHSLRKQSARPRTPTLTEISRELTNSPRFRGGVGPAYILCSEEGPLQRQFRAFCLWRPNRQRTACRRREPFRSQSSRTYSSRAH